jgi:hypothetical protein
VLKAGQDGAAALLLGEHEVLDLDDAGNGVLGIAEELQADGARMRRHAVHDPARAGDQAVAAFLLDAGQAAQELVGDVFAQAFLAEGFAGNVQPLGAQRRFAVGFEILQLEAGHLGVVDLAQVVAHARDFQPLRLGRDHAPGGQVVQRRAPQHGLLAARVHRDVAAYAGGFGGGRVDREHKAAALGGIGHALGDHAGFGPDGGDRCFKARQRDHFHLGHGFELFGVDDGRLPGQRNRPAGVAGAAAARDDGQAQLDAGLDQAGHFHFGVGREDHKRVFDAPVGRVGDVRDAREAVELDVVLEGQLAQLAFGQAAQVVHLAEGGVEAGDSAAGGFQQLAHDGVALLVRVWRAAFFHLGQAVLQGVDQQLAPLGVVQQVVLQIGVALHDPDVAQHFIKHARGAAGAALVAKAVQQVPGTLTEQADDHFAIGERGVVVGNLADAGFAGLCVAGKDMEFLECGRGVHREKPAASDPCPALLPYITAAQHLEQRPRLDPVNKLSYGNPACRERFKSLKSVCHKQFLDCPV